MNPARRHPVSAVVLALDEQRMIGRCVRALRWADEVLVVDSGSTDGTVEAAREAGARVVVQPWLGFSGQRNFGADAARHDWVLFVDADEVLTPTLVRSVQAVLAGDPDPADGFVLDRRDEFMGRVLPQAQTRTRRRLAFVRLYNRTRSRWDPAMQVHEQVVVAGRRRFLRGALLQWRPQSLGEQVERMVRYSQMEAESMRREPPRHLGLRTLLLPLARFIWLYLLRGQWRLGTVGLVHAWLRSSADLLRYAREVDRSRRPTPDHPPGFEY